MAIRTYGPNAVDWEQRVDLDRLRTERLARLQRHARASVARRAAHLRLRQHPLHDRHPHRHLGDGQADPVRAAAARRRAGRLGLRLGRQAPPALQPVARPPRPEPTPRRAGISTLRGASTPTPASPRRSPRKVATVLARARPRQRAARRRPGRDADPRRRCRPRASTSSTASRSSSRPAGSRPPTRSACSPRPARWSTPPTRSSTRSCARACARTSASAWSARCSTTSAASTSRASTRSPASAARRTRTSTATGSSVPATRRSSTSCTATSATAPATTAASRSAARRRRCATPTCAAASTWTRRSRWCKPGATTADIVSLLADRAGVRLRRRGGGVRPAVRPRRRPVDLGEADLQPAGLARPPRGPRGGHGLRAGDLLAGRRRLVGRADRGGGRGHRRRLRGDHQVPGRGAAGRRPALLDRRRRRCRPCASRSRTSTPAGRAGASDRRDDRTGWPTADRCSAGTSRWPSSAAPRRPRYDLFMPGLVKGTTHLAVGPRGGRGRRERGAAPRRLRVRHLPRPPPRDRPRRHARGLPGRADEKAHRALQGQGRLDAPDQADHGMLGSYAIVGAHLPIAAAPPGRPSCAAPTGRGRLLRRRRHQHRRLPRGAQPRRRVEAAGALRLREQPLHGVHADRRRHRGAPTRPPTGPPPTACPAWSSTATTSSRSTTRWRAAVERARAGDGPTVIEAQTYRHYGHSRADPAKYRPARRSSVAGPRPAHPWPAASCSSFGVDRGRRREAADQRAAAIGGRRDRGGQGRAAPPTRTTRSPTSGPTEVRHGGR